MGGAPFLLAVNWRGYTVLNVHNEWTGSRGGGTCMAAAETGEDREAQ